MNLNTQTNPINGVKQPINTENEPLTQISPQSSSSSPSSSSFEKLANLENNGNRIPEYEQEPTD